MYNWIFEIKLNYYSKMNIYNLGIFFKIKDVLKYIEEYLVYYEKLIYICE